MSKVPIPFQELGPYQVTGVLGRGGMGTVYAGVETGTDHQVAIKVLAAGLAMDESFRDRFEAEIESLKKLRHPHIVQLYGYGEQAGNLFYAMERIEGVSLQDELRRQRVFRWQEVIRIAIDICAALKHAHDSGVIHRDLKPANLLLDGTGQIKLVDFGIAKLFGSTSVTTGSVLGTADYMAPEQAEGKPASVRADLYSLGAVLYALFAGRPPFIGKTVAEVVHKLRYEDPVPIRRLNPDVPEPLARTIEQLLEKLPQDRVPTALALSHRLKAMEHALSLADAQPESAARDDQDVVPISERDTDEQPASYAPSLAAQITENPTAPIDAAAAPDQVEILADDDTSVSPQPVSFTRVSPQDDSHGDHSNWLASGLVSLALLVLLGGLVVFARTWFGPPSADELHNQIMDLVASDEPRALLGATSPVQQFLERFPDDERATEIEDIQQEIKLMKRRKQLELKAKLRSTASQSPIEQLYLETLRDPDESSRWLKLDALTKAFGKDDDDQTRQILQLAQSDLNQLQQRMDVLHEQHKQKVMLALDTARTAQQDDDAIQILHSIIRLYSNKPWASEWVDEAQKCLEIRSKSQPN
ncbi:MAG: serine/threonine protein kinase [Planctomycetales bacterium]|nr:serine/threonine protein kinase [Planctomycetales bacterium]